MIIDLFRGPGGWSQGLRTLGITDEHGIDNDPMAHATATAAGHKGELADITTLDPRDYLGENIAGEIASPPCPGFSMAGKGEGRKDLALILAAAADLNRGIDPAAVFGMLRAWQNDERSALTLEPLHWALTLRPSWIALEQVPAVLPIWEAYAAVLSAHGYHTWTGKIHAEQYGVPQTRKRAVLLASLNQKVDRPVATHSRFYSHDPKRLDVGVEGWVSMAAALGWGMTDRPAMTVTGGGIASGGPEPFGNAARKGIIRELNAGRWQFAGAGATSRYTAGQVPRDLDQPAHTITGKGTAAWTPIGDGPRTTRVTVAECAVLQTFPADYPWQGGLGQQFQQVGNAVPPLLAAHLLAELGVGQLPATHQLLATA